MLALVARPYTWWKLVLIGGSVVAYVILFAWPFTREFFALDPSNVDRDHLGVRLRGGGDRARRARLDVTGRLFGERRPMFAADFF